jgi:hypothetical protein
MIKFLKGVREMELTQEQIKFLDTVCKYKWNLNKSGEVDVDGDVYINGMGLTEIPVKFGKVDGWVSCSGNNLTTLKNCPTYVGFGGIRFYSNNLTDYFKNIREEDFPHWDKLYYTETLEQYPFLINIIKKYLNRNDLEWYLHNIKQTKIYY